jgi:hypothetical protein
MLENIEFLAKWANMRREKANSISEIERNSGQVKLGRVVGVLTYETIVLTLLQVQRTLIPSNTATLADFLPWILLTFLPIVPISIYHFVPQRSRLRRALFFGWEGIWVVVFFYIQVLSQYEGMIPNTLQLFGAMIPVTWLIFPALFLPLIILYLNEILDTRFVLWRFWKFVRIHL